MPTQAALSGRSERTAILSTHSLYATATNGTNFPLSAYRARLHVPEAYSTAQPSGLLAASPFPCVGCWPTKPQPLIPFFSKATFLLDIAYDMLLVGSIRPFSVGEVRGGVANAKPALYSHVEKQTLALPSSVFQCSGLSHCLCPPPLWLP